jgi:hypothetical protein
VTEERASVPTRQIPRQLCRDVRHAAALPAARFEFSGEVNPEFLRVSEQLRARRVLFQTST